VGLGGGGRGCPASLAAHDPLLKTVKGNKELRRQIQQRISQLKKETEDEGDRTSLEVGSIRLPTIYGAG
jgi:hypothetical protein